MSETTNHKPVTAGRELDALVAEKVMGWHDLWTGKVYGNLLGYLPSYKLREGTAADDPKNCPQAMDVPRFSSHLEAAWQVVEKLRQEHGEDFDFALTTNEPSTQWCCWILLGENNGAERQAPTAPLSICRAALAAIESEAR